MMNNEFRELARRLIDPTYRQQMKDNQDTAERVVKFLAGTDPAGEPARERVRELFEIVRRRRDEQHGH